MRSDIPTSQVFDAFELESRGLREFYKIEFLGPENSTMYLTPHNEIVWMDTTWEFLPCKISENSMNSNGEVSRPKFSTVNPDGIFSAWIQSGKADGAIVTRYRALLTDIEAGVSAYTKSLWVLSKVISLNKDMVVFELRSPMDGANFSLPARSFYPPDFPTVSLR
jgi:phage-related protein